MSSRLQEWMKAEDVVVKTYEQLQEENRGTATTTEYNERIVKPSMEQYQMENEIRRKLGVPPTWATEREKIEFHRRQLALLERANQAPRCEHIFSDGRRCRSPRVRKGKHCYAHAQMEARRPQRMNLPPLEDANAVAMWLMEVSRGLLDGQISERTAGLLFYGLQLAMVNARWTTFMETNPDEMVRKMPKDCTAKLPHQAKNRLDVDREDAQDAKVAKEITAESAEVAEKEGLSSTSGPACLPSGANRIIEGAQPRAALPMQANPGLPPLQAKTAPVGDPGDESCKSFVFGDDGTGEGESPTSPRSPKSRGIGKTPNE